MNQSFILPRSISRERQIERVSACLSHLPLDAAWSVEVTKHKPKRSDNQNRYLWGIVYPTILKTLDGWDADDLHEYLLGEHFGWEVVEGFGRKRMKPIRRSSRLTKLEFVDFTQFIQRRMSEHGIYIPDPNEGT